MQLRLIRLTLPRLPSSGVSQGSPGPHHSVTRLPLVYRESAKATQIRAYPQSGSFASRILNRYSATSVPTTPAQTSLFLLQKDSWPARAFGACFACGLGPLEEAMIFAVALREPQRLAAHLIAIHWQREVALIYGISQGTPWPWTRRIDRRWLSPTGSACETSRISRRSHAETILRALALSAVDCG